MNKLCIFFFNCSRTVFDYKDVIILGWGTIAFGGPDSDRLREGKTQILPLERCAGVRGLQSKACTQSRDQTHVDACQVFIWMNFLAKIHKLMHVCILNLKGDSGGPVLYFDPTIGRYCLLAITQSGMGCGKIGYCEWVPWYKKFIMEHIDSACLYFN